MDIQKATKAELASAYSALLAENAQLKLDLTSITQFANWLQANLQVIENLLLAAPFLTKEGKFFKKLYWIITNFSQVKALIEEIFKTIKLWRQRVTEIVASQSKTNNE